MGDKYHIDVSVQGMNTKEASNYLKKSFEEQKKTFNVQHSRLVHIELTYNNLTKFDTESVLASKVEKLMLTVNSISDFPDLKDFSCLTELSLSSNKIQHFHVEWIPKQIEIFKINHNELQQIPSLRNLSRLKTFEAAHNRIEIVFGFPDSITDLDLEDNEIRLLTAGCFPNPSVYEVVHKSMHETEIAKLQEPPTLAFNKSYLAVMSYFVDLKILRKIVNKLFTKNHSIKVQSLYADVKWHKIIVNVKKEDAPKVHAILEKKPMKLHVHVIEQPNSPKLLSGKITRGSQLTVTDNTANGQQVITSGTIAGKVIDSDKNIYILTCRHIFSESFGKGKGSVHSIKAYSEYNKKHDLGTEYIGIFGPQLVEDTDDDDDAIWADIALVKISDGEVMKALDDIIQDENKTNCQLFLYKEQCGIELIGTTVQKLGYESKDTNGKLLDPNLLFYYPPQGDQKKAMDTLLIQGTDNALFNQAGDSGSLITTMLKGHITTHTIENHALGICFAEHKNYVHSSLGAESTINASFGVKLHLNLAALEKEFPHLKGLQVCCSKTIMCECPKI